MQSIRCECWSGYETRRGRGGGGGGGGRDAQKLLETRSSFSALVTMVPVRFVDIVSIAYRNHVYFISQFEYRYKYFKNKAAS